MAKKQRSKKSSAKKSVVDKGHTSEVVSPVTETPHVDEEVNSTVPVDSPQPVPDEQSEEVGTMEKITMFPGFTYVRLSRFGDAIYRRAGHKGSVKISKTLIDNAEPPANLDDLVVSAPGVPASVLTPEKIAKLQDAAEKAASRAAKHLARADKIKARLAKVPQTESVAEPEPVSI